MRYRLAAVVTCGVLLAAPVAHAQTVAPQANTPCSADLAGALTQLPDLTTLLTCDGRMWRTSEDPYPHSERWFTYGPTLTLHGEGQRNREIDSGAWTGQPRDAASRCSARPTAIAPEGGVTPPQEYVGEAGRPLRVDLPPLLFTVELSGFCLWSAG